MKDRRWCLIKFDDLLCVPGASLIGIQPSNNVAFLWVCVYQRRLNLPGNVVSHPVPVDDMYHLKITAVYGSDGFKLVGQAFICLKLCFRKFVPCVLEYPIARALANVEGLAIAGVD